MTTEMTYIAVTTAVSITAILAVDHIARHFMRSLADAQKAAADERRSIIYLVQNGQLPAELSKPTEPAPRTPQRANFGTAYGLKVDANRTKEGAYEPEA